jgi:hypothetical protein
MAPIHYHQQEDIVLNGPLRTELAGRSRVCIWSLSGTKIRAALPAELVHRPGTMAYSGSIR